MFFSFGLGHAPKLNPYLRGGDPPSCTRYVKCTSHVPCMYYVSFICKIKIYVYVCEFNKINISITVIKLFLFHLLSLAQLCPTCPKTIYYLEN